MRNEVYIILEKIWSEKETVNKKVFYSQLENKITYKLLIIREIYIDINDNCENKII